MQFDGTPMAHSYEILCNRITKVPSDLDISRLFIWQIGAYKLIKVHSSVTLHFEEVNSIDG